jgi:uncharacterized SAM-binding protein YcdF (DUF218 family)
MTPLVAATMMPRALREFERVSPDVEVAMFEGLLSIAFPG